MTDVSVVIPAHNAGDTLGSCLAALAAQHCPGASFEVIVVDDGSTDATADVARRAGVTLIQQKNAGAAAARNAGIHAARGRWVAFTDSDCIPSRRWLDWLLRAAAGASEAPLGVAGKTVGHDSRAPAARFVDLTGGLDAATYLNHPTFPFAPSCNLMYRRDALLAVGGFDASFVTQETTDLHHRLTTQVGGTCLYEPRALVLHRHRDSWRAYFRQQRAYGRGHAQLFLRYRDQLRWTMMHELRAWGQLAGLGIKTVAWRGDAGLVRRGLFVKQLAQRVGFVGTYWRG